MGDRVCVKASSANTEAEGLRGLMYKWGAVMPGMLLLLLLFLISPFGPRGPWAHLSGYEIPSIASRIKKYGTLHRDGGGVCVGVWTSHTVVVITSLPPMQFQTYCA